MPILVEEIYYLFDLFDIYVGNDKIFHFNLKYVLI
jgi:hypothetical protein